MDNRHSQNLHEARKSYERRRKKDWVVRSVNVVAVIGWVCAVAALLILDRAKPAAESIFTRLRTNPAAAGSWDASLLNIAFTAILISFFVCLAGLFINMARSRRKTDRFNKSIITLGVVSLILIAVFVFNFYL